MKNESKNHINDYPCFGGHVDGVDPSRLINVKGYGKLRIRPIQLDDEEDMVLFHNNLSQENIYLRYFQYLGLDQRTGHDRLVAICSNTPGSYAVVIEHVTRGSKHSPIVAVGRLTKTEESFVAAFDILFADTDKTPQLGRILIEHLIKLSHGFGFLVLASELLVADHYAINLCRELDFDIKTINNEGIVRVKRDLVL